MVEWLQAQNPSMSTNLHGVMDCLVLLMVLIRISILEKKVKRG